VRSNSGHFETATRRAEALDFLALALKPRGVLAKGGRSDD
jgi:hypothetical protein